MFLLTACTKALSDSLRHLRGFPEKKKKALNHSPLEGQFRPRREGVSQKSSPWTKTDAVGVILTERGARNCELMCFVSAKIPTLVEIHPPPARLRACALVLPTDFPLGKPDPQGGSNSKQEENPKMRRSFCLSRLLLIALGASSTANEIVVRRKPDWPDTSSRALRASSPREFVNF